MNCDSRIMGISDETDCSPYPFDRLDRLTNIHHRQTIETAESV